MESHISQHLEVASREHQPQELPPPETIEYGVELIVAAKGAPIRMEPLEILKEVLRLAFLKVGLRADNFPVGEEKDLLHNHIYENYGDHTAAEIKIAFDMALAGKLNLEARNVVCYENFSCAYFSSIMNAYKEWLTENHKKIVKDEPLKEGPKEDLSDKAMLDWFEYTKKQVKNGELTIEFMPVQLAEYLFKNGYLHEGISTEKEEKYVMEAVIRIGKRLATSLDTDQGRKEYSEYKAMYKAKCFEGKWIDQIHRRKMQLILWDQIIIINNLEP